MKETDFEEDCLYVGVCFQEKEARKAAGEMTTWIKMLLDRDSDVLVKLQKKLGSTVGGGKGTKNSSQRSSNGTVLEYLGKRDRAEGGREKQKENLE